MKFGALIADTLCLLGFLLVNVNLNKVNVENGFVLFLIYTERVNWAERDVLQHTRSVLFLGCFRRLAQFKLKIRNKQIKV